MLAKLLYFNGNNRAMSNYITQFNKQLDDLKIEDIISFFRYPQEESNRIEFKSFKKGGKFDDKVKSIIETICAFLNSDGGLVIWGAPEGIKQEEKMEKVFIGDLTYVGKEIDHDQLINRIHDRITPLPMGITVKSIGITPKNIYLIHVKESLTKPHQVENKYMIRLDGQSRIAPHYYIEAMFKQIKYPDLEGYVKFGEITLKEKYLELSIETILFNWSPMINEKNLVIVMYCSTGYFLLSRSRTNINNQFHEYTMGGHMSIDRRINEILFYGMPFQDPETLCFNYDDIKFGQYVELILRFGGETAPQKESHYKFNFKFDKNEFDTIKVVEMKENQQMGEIKKELNIDRIETVKKILGR